MLQLGCSSRFSSSGNFLISCPSRGCIAKTTGAQAISSCPGASERNALLPANPSYQPQVFSQRLLFLHSAVGQESPTLQEASFLGASSSTAAHGLPFNAPLSARVSCSLLRSSICRCCLLCWRWTRNELEEPWKKLKQKPRQL